MVMVVPLALRHLFAGNPSEEILFQKNAAKIFIDAVNAAPLLKFLKDRIVECQDRILRMKARIIMSKEFRQAFPERIAQAAQTIGMKNGYRLVIQRHCFLRLPHHAFISGLIGVKCRHLRFRQLPVSIFHFILIDAVNDRASSCSAFS